MMVEAEGNFGSFWEINVGPDRFPVYFGQWSRVKNIGEHRWQSTTVFTYIQ